MRNIAAHIVRCALVLLLLAGCKEELNRGLSEVEANEIYAILDTNGVAVDRHFEKKTETYVIRVPGKQMGEAIMLLRARGLPRAKFSDMGEVFSGEGLVSTPFEEKARYMHALTQELSESLSRIDGVAEARVHIVLPEPNRVTDETPPSQATVFVYYLDRFDLDASIPKIKKSVESSIEGLDYEKITVTAFRSDFSALLANP